MPSELSIDPFINDETVELHGVVEAAGHGIDNDQGHCATLTKGTPCVLQGSLTYVSIRFLDRLTPD